MTTLRFELCKRHLKLLPVLNEFKGGIGAATRCCAVYGFPIKHSASPAMHNAAFASLGLDWRYLAFPVPPKHLQEALRGAMRMRFAGINLTVPHKILALGMMDVLDGTATTWGAVNTVRFEGKAGGQEWLPLAQLPSEADPAMELRAQGFNTDADALLRSLREDLSWTPQGSNVLVLGAGGAGRVAALRLAAEGIAKLSLVNRTLSKAQALAVEIRLRFPDVRADVGFPREEVDLLVNASSVGLSTEDPLPYDAGQFDLSRARLVYDLIYKPRETRLLAAARAAGCHCANGLGMLLYQGAKAFEIWTGRPAPLDVMRQALQNAAYTQPIIP